jgi:hypothetical protein
MGDTIIVEDEPKPAKPAEVIVVKPEPPKTEKVVTTVTEIRRD